jgi:hypothetical protein
MKKIALGFLLIITSLVSFVAAQTTPAKPKADTLTVVNAEGKSFEFTAADLAKLPRKQAAGKDHDGKDMQFDGYNMTDVLKLAGVKLGDGTLRGKRLAEYLLVDAADNYHAVFSMTEFDPEFTDVVILLADKSNGKSLDAKYGSWQLIVPNQKAHARWVHQVVKLSVKVAQ